MVAGQIEVLAFSTVDDFPSDQSEECAWADHTPCAPHPQSVLKHSCLEPYGEFMN